MLFATAAVICLAAGSWAQEVRCSKDQLDRCLLAVTLESRNDASLSTVDMMGHCRRMRESLNCIIWYTQNCLGKSTRRLTSTIIKSTRGYLSNFCEYFDRVDENWMEKSCFLHHEMEDCKDNFLKHMNGQLGIVNQDTCSQYMLFRRCVDRIFNRRCQEEHNLYLPTYLFDKADQLSWICIDEDSYYMPVDERSLQRSLKGAACLTRNRPWLSQCRSGYDREKETETSDSLASACCAFKEYSHCVVELLPSRCDYESRELAETGLNRMNAELGGMCDSYDHRSEQCSSALRTLSYNLSIFIISAIAAYLSTSQLSEV